MHGKNRNQEEQDLTNRRKRLQNRKAKIEQEKSKKLIKLTECAILKVRTFC